MHLLKGHTVLISPADSKLIENIYKAGINVINTKPVEHLIEYEKYHADMQLLIINDTAFISADTSYLKEYLTGYNIIITDKLKYNYPQNILLNAAVIGKNIICKKDSIAKEVLEYAKIKGFEIINTKQGYSKCSSLVLNSNALITADISIYKAAVGNGINALLITPGHIYLDENNYGFIGGASGVIGNTVLFFGDIKTHPDYKAIINFITDECMDFISLNDGILKDIGGLIQIN